MSGLHRVFLASTLLTLSPSAAAGDWDEVYQKEAARIAPHAARIERKGDFLRLRLDFGEHVALENPPDYCESAENCTVYIFDGILAGAFVPHVLYYESDEFLLIDGRNGARTGVVARPHLDPAGKRFICVLRNEMAGYEIQMWRLTDAVPELEWSYLPDLPLDFVAWRSPDGVELAAVTYTGDGETTAPAHLLRDNEGWRMVGDGFDLRIPPP